MMMMMMMINIQCFPTYLTLGSFGKHLLGLVVHENILQRIDGRL